MSDVWPALQLQKQASSAKQALDARSPRQLRVLTWNVWFDALAAHERQVALLSEVLEKAPDVVCLQEVLPGFADSVRSCKDLNDVYAISPQEVGWYGTMLLVRRDMLPTFEEHRLRSRMGRTLLFAQCGTRWPGLIIVTTHLESLDNEPTRREQLQHARELMQGRTRAVLCGDFNFDDTKTWGKWAAATPPEKLENRVLNEVLPEFVDAWREVHPDVPGYTFDGTENYACIKNPEERMRYDRVMVRGGVGGLQVRAAEILGKRPIDSDSELRPSDHYGLMVDLEGDPDQSV